MDENKKNEIVKWIKKAFSDYNSALKLMEGENKILDTASYHCQQAAEKILKSYLVYQDIPFEKAHSIIYLVNLCSQADEQFKQFYVHAEILTPYATNFRYPGNVFEPELTDVEESLKLSKEIILFVLGIYYENAVFTKDQFKVEDNKNINKQI